MEQEITVWTLYICPKPEFRPEFTRETNNIYKWIAFNAVFLSICHVPSLAGEIKFIHLSIVQNVLYIDKSPVRSCIIRVYWKKNFSSLLELEL